MNCETGDRLSGWAAMRAVVTRLVRDDSGQDIVEYGLLGALVGIAAILIWQQLVVTVGTTYGTANADLQNMSACTPDPGAAACP
jgi:Flp pilus assembly pilin Flp